MNLLTNYSHYCGVKPKEPFIDEQYYPLPFSKYVVIHMGAGMKTKMYDNFEQVAQHIKTPIVQLGGKDDELLVGAFDLRGKTSLNQTAYLIHKASLFIGGDSICAHMAASFATPSIVLWGGTLPTTCSTNWNQDKVIHFTPVSYMGCATACHSNECIRATKCINTITPSSILYHVSNVLGKESVVPVEILHIGALSKVQMLEWVPIDGSQETFNVISRLAGVVSIRGDCFADTNFAQISNLCNQTNLKFVVLANPNQLVHFNIHHSKIERLMILVDKDTIGEGIKYLKDFTTKMYKAMLISRSDSSEFNNFKLDIMDYPPILKLTDFEYTAQQKEMFVGKTFNIQTRKKVIGELGKFYLTFADAINRKNDVEIHVDNVIVNIEESHLKELQHLNLRKYA